MQNRILIFAIVLFFVSDKLVSQVCNLIKNGNFEQYSSCPTFSGEMSKAIGWSQGTISPTWPSSDYYNTCGHMNTGGGITPPLAFPSGNGCAGVYTNYGITPNNYYKEEAAQKLDFCAGQKYRLEIYLAKPATGGYTNIAGNLSFEIGNAAVLPTNVVNPTTYCATGFVQATSVAGNLITSQWQPFTRTFTATQNANAFMITGACNGPHTVTGYVFFDSVRLIAIDTLTIVPGTISTCDSANFTITIPGTCYGPYDVTITDGTNNYNLTGINSGYVFTAFPTQTTNYTVTSITNKFGCKTNLNIPFTAIGGQVNNMNVNANLCNGDNYTLPDGVVVNSAGTYVDTLTNISGCDSIITTNITVTFPPIATANSSTSINVGESATINASGGGTYNWQPSTGLNTTTGNSVIASPNVTTTYCVIVTDNNGCTDSACVTITVMDVPCITNPEEVGVPNAFSPNGDNINDEFCLQGWKPCIEVFLIEIFNRWGSKIYSSTDPDFCWDGKFNGAIMDASVCTYSINAKIKNVDKPVIKNGNISLIR